MTYERILSQPKPRVFGTLRIVCSILAGSMSVRDRVSLASVQHVLA